MLKPTLKLTQTAPLQDYLAQTPFVDFQNPDLLAKAVSLTALHSTSLEKAKALFEFVRDQIPHSYDQKKTKITGPASEVLAQGHGICFAKSNLLAALCRAVGIPTGFCYQKLVFDDDAPVRFFTLHGLNAVYLEEPQKWIRLDARGNKPGVNAQFSLTEEQLAFPVRPELGEVDYPEIFAEPNVAIVTCLTAAKNWDFEALDRMLPGKLA